MVLRKSAFINCFIYATYLEDKTTSESVTADAKKQPNQALPFQGVLQMSLLQKDSRTAFSDEAADGNISSGMFVCSCISWWGQACVVVVIGG